MKDAEKKGNKMENRVEKALANHEKGYNCAQSVACAFCDMYGMEEKDVFKMAEAFGFGMGTMDTCGAVTGMSMVVGMCMSDGNMEAPATKKECYGKMEELTQAFLEKNKTLLCRDLKGTDETPAAKSCDEYIAEAAEILEEWLVHGKS